METQKNPEMDKCELRLLGAEAVQRGTQIADLKVVYAGSVEDCHAHAIADGYKWVSDRAMLFGGYYTDETSGNVLYLT